MKKKIIILMLVICALVAFNSTSFANVFASDLSAPATFDRGVGETATIQYRLNDDATDVRIEIYGPLPDTTVRRILDSTEADPAARPGTSRGLHSVVWDGKNEAGVGCAAGTYKFRVIAEQNPGYSDWTNITPRLWTFQLDWATSTPVYGGDASSGNEIRDCCYYAPNDTMIITSTAPRKIAVVNANDGSYIRDLPLITVDTYDLDADGNTTETFDWNAWLGPYAIKSDNGHDDFYMTPFRGASGPTGRFDDDASTSTWALIAGYHARSNAVAGDGVNTLIYTSNYSTGEIDIWKTDTGTTFSLLEHTGILGSHVIIAKPTNTGGDGDVIWAQQTSGPGLKRYVRSGGSWVEDTNFVCAVTEAGFHHGDYANILGQDVVICASSYHTVPKIYALNGDTGDLLAEITVPSFGTPINSATAGLEVYQATPGSDRCEVYFGLGTNHVYGKLTFGNLEIGSAQYDYIQGIETIKDQSSPWFGKIFVSNGYPELSYQPGAEADQQGVYVLNNDMTWYGGSVDASYAAAMNDPANPWDPTDGWSPYRLHLGWDGCLYLGDSGTYGVTDAVYRYDLTTTATKILVEGGANHGRVAACQTVTSNTVTTLVGYDRDSGSYRDIVYWSIGSTTENYTGPEGFLAHAPSGYGLSDLYTIYDLVIDSEGKIYVCNSRWTASQTSMFCADWDNPTAYNWRLTGADIAAATDIANGDGLYVRSIAVDERLNRVAGLTAYTYYSGGNWCIIVNRNTGAVEDAFNVTPEYYYTTYGVAFDPAGNVLTGDRYEDHLRMWSPPGPNSYTTEYSGQIELQATAVKDWMVF